MLPSLLPFERLPVTILVLGCYLAAIISTLVIQERLPAARRHQRELGLNLDEAWKDLQKIAQIAHPFNTHTNDRVHSYIAEKLKKNVQNYNHFVEIDDYSPTNVTFYRSPGWVAYMESRNIIIKFEGSKWNNSAILWGAHYDTSSLAPGATDDSIAVVSLLQLADHFASNQPERTMIILFNSGEEDGLNGAQHPWARLVESFINVEGAGAGGRPNLFRTSSAQITQAFKSSVHPHGSSVFSDAFKTGLIRSVTDYDVYTKLGIPGVDFAFYTGRQKYHTMSDTISSLHDRRPLWSMMENLHSVAQTLAYEPESTSSYDTDFVYFDLFGEDMFYLRYDFYLLLNILLVVLGPILVALLGYSLSRNRKLLFGWRGWGRFPLAFLIGVLAAGSSMAWYTEHNPMVVYRFSYLVLLSVFCLISLGFMVPLYLADWLHPVSTQRSQVLMEMFGLWWILSIVNLILTSRLKISATYFITFFYSASLAAVLINLLDMHRLTRKSSTTLTTREEIDGPSQLSQEHGSHDQNNGRLDDEAASERTPLIPRTESPIPLPPLRQGESELGWIWILEFLLLAVFPAIIMLQILFSMSEGLGPTVVEGSSPLFVYLIVSAVIFLIVLPIAPFAHKISPIFYGVLVLVGISAFAYNTLQFPFSPNAAFKVFFWQTTDLNAGNSTIMLTGLEHYLRQVLEEVPSIDFDSIDWIGSSSPSPSAPRIAGLIQAQYEGLAPRSNPEIPMSDWIDASFKKTSMTSIRARISGSNTRACRLYLDGGYNVPQVVIRGADQTGYELPSSEPVKLVELWRRGWNGTWEVDLELMGPGSSAPLDTTDVLQGRVSCIWSDREQGKIPALDDLFVFFPTWATMTAMRGGLVEGWKSFSV